MRTPPDAGKSHRTGRLHQPARAQLGRPAVDPPASRDRHAGRNAQSRLVLPDQAGRVNDDISVSVVSHGQAALVAQLLEDLRRHKPSGIEILLTLNTEEALPFDPASFPFPLTTIRNPAPRGFGSNHNSAFARARGAFFCVLNPDIRLTRDPFPALVGELRDASVGAAAPLILDPAGGVEASARPFPTLFSLARKALGLEPQRYYEIGKKSISPDWVAGMFVMLRREVFAAVGGFDTGYHLDYEDVDLCARLGLAGRTGPRLRSKGGSRCRSRPRRRRPRRRGP